MLVVAAWPGSMFPSWTPRFAVLLVVGLLGVVHLARLVRLGEAAALLAVGVIATFGVSALAAPGLRSSALGFVGRDLSLASALLFMGCWAFGRSTSNSRAVAWSFVASASFVSMIGLVQVVADIDKGFLALQSGRPASLLVNPVYFGAICAGGAVAAAGLAAQSSRLLPAALACSSLLSAGVAVSGSRVAAIGLVLASLLIVVSVRATPALVAIAAVALGGVFGTVLELVTGSGRNAASRLGDTDGDGRSTVWGYGIEAWRDRPILGHGIGRFRPATQQFFELDFVAEHAFDDRTQAWFDPHNVVIMVLVAAGVVGLLVVACWLAFAARECSGPLLWASMTIAATWLLQPVSIHTMPVALLLFGASRVVVAADETRDVDEGAGREIPVVGWRLAEQVALSVGVLAAGVVLVADARLDRAVDRLDPDAAASAAGWYWDDPIVDDVVAQVYEFRGDLATSLVWRERVVAAEPDRPYWWSQLARARIVADDFDGGRRAIAQALELQPNNARARGLEVQLAEIEAGG